MSESLPVAVLLGTDVPEVYQLLAAPVERPTEDAMVVITRARAQQHHGEGRLHDSIRN